MENESQSKNLEAFGLIKHISHKRRRPGGSLRVVSPPHLRGLSVKFRICDVKLPEVERDLLSTGMTLQFSILGDSNNGFYALDLKPVELCEFNGRVIKGPTPDRPTRRLTVALELMLDSVICTPESVTALNLKSPLTSGDYVRVSMHWKDLIEALRAGRKPEWNLVKVFRNVTTRARSSSSGRRARNSTSSQTVARVPSRAAGACEDVSLDELSPQYERGSRDRETSEKKVRQRSKSVSSSANENSGWHSCSSCAQNLTMSCQYAASVSSEMLYASYARLYGSMWMNMAPTDA